MTNITQEQPRWKAILFVAIFWAIFYVAQVVTFAVVIGQCLFKAFTGNPNPQLTKFGASLTDYIKEILTFVTFNSERRPFPFNDFPSASGVIIDGDKSVG
jgi:hypothetical protein